METLFCQSCGMPLREAADFGNNKDLSRNTDYCSFCYIDGQFTSDLTMDEMIEHNLEFLEMFNKDSEKQLTPEEAREQMRKYFPTLKRWKE